MEQIDAGECKTCQRSLLGNFCHHCGQKKISPEDKKLKHFIEEFISSLFVANGKVLVTFKNLFIKPGSLSQSYMEGATKKFLSPLKLFFFANLIYFLFPIINTFSTDLHTQLQYQIYSNYTKELVQDYLREGEVSYEEYRVGFEQVSNNLGKVLLIILVVFQALFFRLFFVKRKELYFVDFLAVASYFISFYILTCLVIYPLIISGIEVVFQVDCSVCFTNDSLTVVYNTLSIIYLTILLRRAFSISIAKSIIGAILSTLFLVPTFIVYRFILFIITHGLVTY